MNVLEEGYAYALAYIRAYGWRIVALCLAYVFLKPYLYSCWDNIKALDPHEVERKRILDRDMRQVRKLQQHTLASKS